MKNTFWGQTRATATELQLFNYPGVIMWLVTKRGHDGIFQPLYIFNCVPLHNQFNFIFSGVNTALAIAGKDVTVFIQWRNKDTGLQGNHGLRLRLINAFYITEGGVWVQSGGNGINWNEFWHIP